MLPTVRNYEAEIEEGLFSSEKQLRVQLEHGHGWCPAHGSYGDSEQQCLL